MKQHKSYNNYMYTDNTVNVSARRIINSDYYHVISMNICRPGVPMSNIMFTCNNPVTQAYKPDISGPVISGRGWLKSIQPCPDQMGTSKLLYIITGNHLFGETAMLETCQMYMATMVLGRAV